MQSAQVKQTEVKVNRASKEILYVTAEIRKNQTVSAEWIAEPGVSDGIQAGDWVFLIEKSQAIGSYYAIGMTDIVNSIFAERGVKILYSRDAHGAAKSKITLTEKEIILETSSAAELVISENKLTLSNASGAEIKLDKADCVINSGPGFAVEATRLQAVFDLIASAVSAEFVRVQAGTLPNPVNPYVPVPLKIDSTAARSQNVRLP